ncbi:MAG: DUF1501 domain-containing protein, partial [Planctomycetaceae bacterium]|nr:DUF1501 domain-containing protein [Planctomycetaceae bacterium]
MTAFTYEQLVPRRGGFSRRRFLHQVSAASLAAGTLGFRDVIGLGAEELRRQGRSVILLWMQGGPSQLETFDPRPGTENGGETEAIETAVPGIQIASGWETTAAAMQDIALIRSMTNREGNHQRATWQMHTGYIPSGSVKHPSLAACLAKETADPDRSLPAVVSVGPSQGAGFLGVDYDPFVVSNPGSLPRNVGSPVQEKRLDRRLGLLDQLEGEFAARGGSTVVGNHRQIYGKAARLVTSEETQAFDFASESPQLIARYGATQFGRGCLLARRLVEAGVTFVEVVSGGWDTHADNFDRTKTLAGQVDPGMGTLIADLRERGLLDSTLVLWMGEFGRTPRINPRGGRDHYPRVFNAAVAGCGVKGGQVIGRASADGMQVEDNPVSVADLFCSICEAMQVDPRKENISPLGRPMK